MVDFLRFLRVHLRDRALLGWALCFAFLAATSLGAGLLGMVPLFKQIFDPEGQDRSLHQWAVRWNDGDHFFDLPLWIVERLPTDRFQGVIYVVAGLILVSLVGATFNFLHQYFSITLAVRTVARVRQTMFEHVLRMPLTRVSHTGPSHYVARIIRDAGELQQGIIALTGKGVANLTKGAVGFLIGILAGGRLTLAALVVAPIVIVAMRKLGRRIRRGTRGSLRGQEELLHVATQSVQGLRVVKANTGEEAMAADFARQNDTVVKQELVARLAKAIASPLLEMIAVVALGGLAIYAGREIIGGRLTIDRFVLALYALAVAGSAFKPLASVMTKLQAASAPAKRIAQMLAQVHEAPENAARPDLPRHDRSIVFEAVSFTYPDKAEPAVRDVSLTITHGQRVAVVGPNGSGKTTLLSMIPRLLTPESGRVLIDDVDVAGYNLRSLRRQVGVVTQETVLFRGTIADNIAFGLPMVDRQRIEEAARLAHAHGFIIKQSDGYDTNLAEMGASLSGGQRQRLDIARALLRDPSILILDEATNQIDAESEAQINQAIEEISRERTVLLIAHRLSTVIHADLIVVMDEGRIVDAGRHEELQERCEVYRRLSRTQLLESA